MATAVTRPAITRRSRADVLTAGNRVSRVVTAIMTDYPTKVPVGVTLMDVAGRDALYASQQGRWADAAKARAELGRNYAAVQVHVRARDPALDRATSLAQALLDDVDRIEQTF